MQRTVLLQFKDETHGISFRVERWFLASDSPTESMIKAVLVWDDDGGTERVVALGRKAVRAVIGELMPFA